MINPNINLHDTHSQVTKPTITLLNDCHHHFCDGLTTASPHQDVKKTYPVLHAMDKLLSLQHTFLFQMSKSSLDVDYNL